MVAKGLTGQAGNNKLQAPPDFKIGPNKLQYPNLK